MNIKTAAERTGLTKKAIKYYEAENLITPSKNFENCYREYSEEDIVRLNLIGALRALDISIKDIKAIVLSEKRLPEVLKDKLAQIDENINHLEKNRLIISTLIEQNLEDYMASGEQIRKLRETLELSRDGKKELISNSLLRIFPGGFGRMFVILYEPFLRVNIDNEEKEKIWIKLVEFLDSADEIDEENYPEELREINLDKDKLDEFKIGMDNKFNDILNYDDKIKNDMISNQIKFVKSLKENQEIKQKFTQSLDFAKKLGKLIGPVRKDFEEYLCGISEHYKKYRENAIKMMLDIQNGVKDKIEFNINEIANSR